MQCPPRGRALSERTLSHHARRVAVPTYDRAHLSPGVVHIGVGGFHRAHQAVYLDDLAAGGVSMDWGIVGVGLRSTRARDALVPQDCLYTVVQPGANREEVRVIGALRGCLAATDSREAVLRLLASQRTRLVTLTVTAAGYHVGPRGELACEDPEIADDLRRPGAPTTLPGYLVEALDRRRRAGVAPFTVMSCDNVPGNGAVARACVMGLAEARDGRLARWIGEQVAFPHSMIDRITPRTTIAARRSLVARHGVADRWPVTTEAFSQWIVEDAFCGSRPPLESVGVQFVADVEPFELVKKRLLNGTHCAIAYLGLMAGLETPAQAMSDPSLGPFTARLMDEEVAPLLPRTTGLDVAAYARTVRRRLANPRIGDQLERLSARGATKVPAYLLPSLAAARRARRPFRLLALAVAGWLVAADRSAHDPLLGELAGEPEVVAAVRTLRSEGVRGALSRSLSAPLEVAA